MAKYVVTITNGVGSEKLPRGQYTVTSEVPGYLDGLLDPTTFTASETEASQNFTIAATGTLTLKVTETGDDSGTPISGGSFIRCNSDGSETYGPAKTVSAAGECLFESVPYGKAEDPFHIYIKQLTSDQTHSTYAGVITVAMEQKQYTQYVKNPAAALQSFTFTDKNYSGLNMNGTMTFEGPQIN